MGQIVFLPWVQQLKPLWITIRKNIEQANGLKCDQHENIVMSVFKT